MREKGKGKGDKGKGRIRRFVAASWLLPFAFSLLPSPLSQVARAQTEVPPPLSSRPVSPRFQTIGLEDGLSIGSVNDIFQDRRGFMWFATQDGLNRWDGYEMKVFKHQPFDSTSMSSSWATGVTEDADGNLWVATFGGLQKLNPLTGRAESWIPDPDDSTAIPSRRLSDVHMASDGQLWIGTWDAGLLRMDPQNPGVGFGDFARQRVFGRYRDEARTAHSVGAGGIADDRVAAIGAPERDFDAARLADPVALHQLDLLGPVVEPVDGAQQVLGKSLILKNHCVSSRRSTSAPERQPLPSSTCSLARTVMSTGSQFTTALLR